MMVFLSMMRFDDDDDDFDYDGVFCDLVNVAVYSAAILVLVKDRTVR
jgi:hypothetical protein